MWLNKQSELEWLDAYMKPGFDRFVGKFSTKPNYIIIYHYNSDKTNTFSIKFGMDLEKEKYPNHKYRSIKLTPDIQQMLNDRNYKFLEKEVKLLELDIKKEKILNDF